MEFRDLNFTVVQGIERATWKWSVSRDDQKIDWGTATNGAQAVIDAKQAIDRALAPKRKPRARAD
jgi:hypothetical protein